jgi:transmembrane sensor
MIGGSEDAMSRPDDAQATIRDEASAWHARIESADMDWDGFAAWLDRDPRHRDSYDEIALIDAEIEANRAAIAAALPANDSVPSPSRSRGWWAGGGLAIAASLAVLAVPQQIGRAHV